MFCFQEYIISVCNPEVRCRVDFPVSDLLEEKGTVNIVDEVERKSCAYLAVDSEGYLEICGSNMAVALATSSLDQMKSFLQSSDTVKTDYNENQIKSEEVKDTKDAITENPDTEVVWKRRETTPKIVKPSRCNGTTPSMKECQPSSLTDEMKATNSKEIESVTDKQVDKCVKESTSSILTENSDSVATESKLISTDSITECDHGHGQSNVLSGESLRDFALKLRYSESEVSSALSKLGPEADKNLLLMELVKAQNSAKQIEEGSSLDRPQSTPPVVCSDPNTLRAIVLDGSNVAMR